MSKNVKVAVRCRKEHAAGQAETLICSPQHKHVIVDDKQYSFDYVLNSDASQEDVYQTTIVPLIEKFLNGENVVAMAYGQTGSGKTFTMGTAQGCQERNADLGITPRVLQRVFEHVKQVRDDEMQPNVQISVSFLEIYNEDVYDILNPNRPKVQIRQQDGNNVKLTDQTEYKVDSYEDGMRYLHEGAAVRTTGATATSAHSSRSHAIFYVHLSRTSRNRNTFLLVDLAGSESVKKTKTQGARFQEGININKSLLALSKVIRALNQDKAAYHHTPYRDSSLTRLLQGCLQDQCNLLVIACISPVEENLAETNNTMQFATCAHSIKIRDRNPWSAQKRKPQSFSTPKAAVTATVPDSTCKLTNNETILSGPFVISQKLDFSQLSAVQEDEVEEAPFKRPKSPPRPQSRAFSFTPYANMICSRLEKCITDLKLATHPPPPPSPPAPKVFGFNSPACQQLVDTIAQRTIHVLKESTNLQASRSTNLQVSRSTFPVSDDTTFFPTDSTANATVVHRPAKGVDGAGPTRRSHRLSATMQSHNWTPGAEVSTRDSILLSSNRNQRGHTETILRLLNQGTIHQLQLLPCVGVKSSVIIHNWVTQEGPLQKISDLYDIPSLTKGFVKKFVTFLLLAFVEGYRQEREATPALRSSCWQLSVALSNAPSSSTSCGV